MSFIWWLLKSSVVQTFALNEVRHLATLASGAALTWLLTHHAAQGDATNIAEGLSALIIGGAGYAFSEINASNNKAVTEVAAATGQIVKPPEAKALIAQGVTAQMNTDQGRADRTEAAIAQADAAAPKDKDALLADLAGGKS